MTGRRPALNAAQGGRGTAAPVLQSHVAASITREGCLNLPSPSRLHEGHPDVTTTPSDHTARAAGRTPGEWPATPHADELHRQVQRERARHEMTVGAIRGHLEEQPSPNAIRACARHWCVEITQLAESVITAQNTPETYE